MNLSLRQSFVGLTTIGLFLAAASQRPVSVFLGFPVLLLMLAYEKRPKWNVPVVGFGLLGVLWAAVALFATPCNATAWTWLASHFVWMTCAAWFRIQHFTYLALVGSAVLWGIVVTARDDACKRIYDMGGGLLGGEFLGARYSWEGPNSLTIQRHLGDRPAEWSERPGIIHSASLPKILAVLPGDRERRIALTCVASESNLLGPLQGALLADLAAKHLEESNSQPPFAHDEWNRYEHLFRVADTPEEALECGLELVDRLEHGHLSGLGSSWYFYACKAKATRFVLREALMRRFSGRTQRGTRCRNDVRPTKP